MFNFFKRKPNPPPAEPAAPTARDEFSKDLFDYLADMPGLPSRDDRDALVQRALEDSTQEKRVKIWDYFFPLDLVYVGKPQLKKIQDLNIKRSDKLRRIRNRFTTLMAWFIGTAIVGGFFRFQSFLPELSRWGWLAIAGGISGALGGWIWFGLARRRLKNKIGAQIYALEQMIEELTAQAPTPPSDTEINTWLEEEIARLTEEAVGKTSPSNVLPLNENLRIQYILAHAKLQDPLKIKKCLPHLPGKSDFEKHLEVYRSGSILDDQFDIFYGIYYIEIFILHDKALANFGCFVDFITGKTYGEHIKEMSYNDVVALTIRYEYQQTKLSWLTIPQITLFTFSLSLKSGERIEATLPSEEFLEQYALLHNQRLFLPEHWARNPKTVVNKVVAELRKQVFPHKP